MLQDQSYVPFDRQTFLKDPDNILFDFPLVKGEGSGPAGDEHWRLEGVASHESKDAQDELVVQRGINFKPLMDYGYINYDHQPGPSYLIGWPVECHLVNAIDVPELQAKGLSGQCLWVKAELYTDRKLKPVAGDVWDHCQAIQGTPRKLGWSVQGRVTGRDPLDKARITECEVRHLAVTHQPVHQITFADMVKSMTTVGMTTTTAKPALRENLSGPITEVLYGACEGKCYGASGRFGKGWSGMLGHLQNCHGLSKGESLNIVTDLVKHRGQFQQLFM